MIVMVELILILTILLIFFIIIKNDKKEHIRSPGASSRYETEANFNDDRAEFTANEVKFYSRYTT